MSNTAGRGMRNNRLVALGYRTVAFVAALIGLLNTLGVFRGEVNGEMLLFYTTETNVFVVLIFALLLIRTALDIKNKGTDGPSSYHERLTAIVTLSISVTMLVFWFLLAPAFESLDYLLSYSNLQIHLITPLLMIFDYFYFAEPGKLKKQDPWLFALIPLEYLAQATILGFAGFVYDVLSKEGTEVHNFPYFFIDYHQLQGWVFAYVAVIFLFFIALAYLLLWFDHRRARRRLTPPL
jgi:hypothetical protein